MKYQRISDELLAHMSYAKLEDKNAVRAKLEDDIQAWIAKGNKITQAESTKIEVKHGTKTQYSKMGCRCKTCKEWAIKVGLLKKTTAA